jgi:hypothetical protein
MVRPHSSYNWNKSINAFITTLNKMNLKMRTLLQISPVSDQVRMKQVCFKRKAQSFWTSWSVYPFFFQLPTGRIDKNGFSRTRIGIKGIDKIIIIIIIIINLIFFIFHFVDRLVNHGVFQRYYPIHLKYFTVQIIMYITNYYNHAHTVSFPITLKPRKEVPWLGGGGEIRFSKFLALYIMSISIQRPIGATGQWCFH